VHGHWRAQVAVNHPPWLWGFDSLRVHVKTPHCGVYCRRLADGREYHYHSGSKRRGHRRASHGLRNDRFDDLAPRHTWDVTDRGAVRAAERNAGL